jgi:hypothetical protein
MDPGANLVLMHADFDEKSGQVQVSAEVSSSVTMTKLAVSYNVNRLAELPSDRIRSMINLGRYLLPKRDINCFFQLERHSELEFFPIRSLAQILFRKVRTSFDCRYPRFY